jgi:ABC-type transporter Mla MlaB component
VLKITEMYRDGSVVTLRLEGKVLAPWLEELQGICRRSSTGGVQVRLDLDAVTFADAAGAALLRELIRRGITVTRCSAFVAELLQLGQK